MASIWGGEPPDAPSEPTLYEAAIKSAKSAIGWIGHQVYRGYSDDVTFTAHNVSLGQIRAIEALFPIIEQLHRELLQARADCAAAEEHVARLQDIIEHWKSTEGRGKYFDAAPDTDGPGY